MIIEGRYADLTFLMVFGILVALYIYRGRRGKMPSIRRLPAIDAIDELVGRAAEMGRPVLFVADGFLTTIEAPQVIASFTVLDYLAHLTAKIGARFLVSIAKATHIPLVTDIVREAYRAEGKSDEYSEENLRFFGEGYANTMPTMGLISREKPASFIILGAWQNPALTLLESSVREGCLSIGGTANTHQLPWMVLTATYTLISEELFVAGAYLSEDPVSVGTVGAGDVGRYISIGLIAIGIVLETLGVTWLGNMIAL